MGFNRLKYLLILFLILITSASMAEDMVNAPDMPAAEPERDYRELEPAPDERANIPFNRKPGQFKRNKFWLIDPSPDVVSL
ncbi:MAG: hypothetical protein AAB356_07730, partial [Deltaproteobacteria bacterium]